MVKNSTKWLVTLAAGIGTILGIPQIQQLIAGSFSQLVANHPNLIAIVGAVSVILSLIHNPAIGQPTTPLSSQGSNAVKNSLGAFLIVAIGLSISGCSYHNLVLMEHDFDSGVKALQAAEANEFQAGNLDSATHEEIESVVLQVAEGGQQVATLLKQNASKQSIVAEASIIGNSLNSLLQQGVVGIKNPTTKQNLTIIIQSLQAILANFQTAVGSAK